MVQRLTTITLGALLVAVLAGWWFDRASLFKEVQKIKSTQVALNSFPSNEEPLLSEADLVLFDRWADKRLIVRILGRHNSFLAHGTSSGFETFEESIEFEAIVAVSEAFLGKDKVKRLGFLPTPLQISKEVLGELDCVSVDAFFELAKKHGFDESGLYPHFLKSSPQNDEFVSFLCSVIEDRNKIPGAKNETEQKHGVGSKNSSEESANEKTSQSE